MTDDSYAPPGAFPNSALGNVTIAGAASVNSLNLTGASTISGGAPTLTGAATITGAGTGTLTNSPHAGDPFTFLEISINGTVGAIPVYALT